MAGISTINPISKTWLNILNVSIAENKHRSESKFLQLASISDSALPEVRTVVFRGFVDSSSTLVIHTDIRSTKVSQIKAQSKSQICWYFTETREQYRFSGEIEIIDCHSVQHQRLRLEHWKSISKGAQQSYSWQTPGSELELGDNPNKNPSDQESIISENFSLLLFSVKKVDHLQLLTVPHARKIYQLENDLWHSQEVNP